MDIHQVVETREPQPVKGVDDIAASEDILLLLYLA